MKKRAFFVFMITNITGSNKRLAAFRATPNSKNKCMNMFNTKWHGQMKKWTYQENEPRVVLNPNLDTLINDYIRRKWKYVAVDP